MNPTPVGRVALAVSNLLDHRERGGLVVTGDVLAAADAMLDDLVEFLDTVEAEQDDRVVDEP